MEPDWTRDATYILDGQKCVECGGTIVADPVELYCEPVLRCRDCGDLP